MDDVTFRVVVPGELPTDPPTVHRHCSAAVATYLLELYDGATADVEEVGADEYE